VPGGNRSDDPYHGADAVLVAIEPVDGRKGIDSLVRVCQGQLSEDPMTVVFLCSGAGEEHRFGCSAMTARDIGWLRSAFRRGGSRGGLNRAQRRSGLSL